ncbi:TonB-dependent receptor [candidate division KSB1 bacterium]|nr:TonB-dependent receptor [candidate division KSB1 bacterium]
MKRVARLLLLALLAVSAQLVLPSYVAAQSSATLKGKVVDAKTGQSLPGVNLVLSGTGLGTITGEGGGFEITKIKPRSYELVASMIGYKAASQSVMFTAGGEVTLEIKLEAKPVTLGDILVQADRPVSAASSRAVRDFDLKIRPMRSAQDILQLAPGLIIAQHAGGGKAEQIYLRGFDADHGTDVNISVDGIPVNMVSHGHGQGYADAHFIIPDVIEGLDVYKGPYFAEFGNLATAGAIAFRSRDHIDNNLVRVEGGEFGTYRMTTLFQIPTQSEHNNAYLAAQFYKTDGPVTSPQDFRRLNLFGKFHTHLSENTKLAFDISSFSTAWNASGQIPERAIAQGLINRFGSLDDLEGGTTGRQNLNMIYSSHGADNSDFQIQTYTTQYNFKLFSNFTFFLDDPVNGDMIEQTDSRRILGLNGRYRFYHNLGLGVASATLGAGYRADDIEVSLWKSPDRVRLSPLVDTEIFERNLFMWAQEDLTFSSLVRLQLGVRADYFTFNVEDRLEGVAGASLPHASGYSQETIVSPKANLIVTPARTLDVFVNFGTGFHSNDARDVVINQRVADLSRRFARNGLSEAQIADTLVALNFGPSQRGAEILPRAVGGEVGLRTRCSERVHFGAAAWALDLEREFVYVGDAGTTELSGKTRRLGIDVETRLGLASWLWADADVTLSKGIARDEPKHANEIPLAPRFTSTGGLTARSRNGFDASLRYRHVGERPANEANTVRAKGYTVFDLSGDYQIGKYKLNLVVENLFDVDWNEAQFDTESRLRNESEPVSELHFTPGNPRNVRVGLSYLF